MSVHSDAGKRKDYDEASAEKSLFAEPVDPVRDEAPGYFDLVKNPMDLRTIREKLDKGEYSGVEQWKNDVNLVFSNAVLYNGKSSAVGVIAAELQLIFRGMAKQIARLAEQSTD